MRPHKSTILIALVALLLTALVAVMGQQPTTQTPAQNADQKKAESCCCKDDSCPMHKKDGATMSADMATASADAKHDCCGDSCKMKMEGANGNGAAASADAKNAKHDCCGDSCDMANHAKHAAKHDSKSMGADAACCKMKSKDAKDAKEKN